MQTLIEWIMLNKVAIISGLVFLLTITGACSKINKYFGLPDDNAVEQRIEEIVKDETGVKIDLTPSEQEKEIANGKEEKES